MSPERINQALANYFDVEEDCRDSRELICHRARAIHFDFASILPIYDLFYPVTKVIEGYVFLRSPGFVYDENEFIQEREDFIRNRFSKDMLDSYNWFEFYYAFGSLLRYKHDSDSWVVNEIEKEGIRLLRRSWALHLEREYPERKFDVFAITPKESGSVWSLGFREV